MKNTRPYYITLVVTLIVLITLPAIQQMTGLFKLPPLKGFNNPVEMPELTFENYKSGNFQSGVNDYLKDNLGFREWLIPLYNQYAWDLYRKTENNGVFFGKDNWLFFWEHMQDQYESLTYKYANTPEEMAATFEKDAKSLYMLQEVLKSYGTTLFVCISPSKNELYSDLLPENKNFYKPEGVHADVFYPKRFKELGVNFLDLNALYKIMIDSVDYPLFYKAGSHYTHLAATYTADTLVKYMEAISGLNIQNFTFQEPYTKKPKNIDRDMENLYNLIFPIEKVDYYYVSIDPVADSTAIKPKWLTIGDSFYWNIAEEIREAGLFEATPFWYYNKEVYFDPGRLYTDELNIVDELISADIVMLYWCPINLYALEHGFVNNALLSFCYDPNYRRNLIEYMKNDEEWYNSIVEKANDRGVSIDEMLKIDADYMINQRIEEDFGNFDDTTFPSVRIEALSGVDEFFKDKSATEIFALKQKYRQLKKENPDADWRTLFEEAAQ